MLRENGFSSSHRPNPGACAKDLVTRHLNIPVSCSDDSKRPTVTSTKFDSLAMASAEGEAERRTRRKLVKKKVTQRRTSMHFPEQLKYGDDVQDDVTATNGKPAQYMNQSLFSMIAAAGSKTNFHARFEDESSDSEGDDDVSKAPAPVATHAAETPSQALAGKEHDQTVGRAKDGEQHVGSVARRHPRIPLPKLNVRTSQDKDYMSQSSFLPSARHNSFLEGLKQVTPRDAPVMSQMLAARAQLSPTTGHAEDPHVADVPDVSPTLKSHGTLATRLMEIFGLEAPEEVVSGS